MGMGAAPVDLWRSFPVYWLYHFYFLLLSVNWFHSLVYIFIASSPQISLASFYCRFLLGEPLENQAIG